MNHFRIIQPQIKEFGCGVTDHSSLLLEQLKRMDFTVMRHSVPNRASAREVPIVGGDTWILQLSIYGYSAKGIPLWLPPFLDSAKRSGVRLIVCFHEIWVLVAPRMSTAYWLASTQKRICQQIARLADHAFFNTDWAFKWGRREIGERATYYPTFSNVGEPADMTGWSERESVVVVFGSELTRRHIYRAATTLLAERLERGTLSAVVDIGASGPWLSRVAESFPGTRFKALGPLAVDEVSSTLLSSKWGLFNTPWGQGGKSSVFAAYASHGVAPVSIFDGPGRFPRPEIYPLPGVHFLPFSRLAEALPELDRASEAIAKRLLVQHAGSRELAEKIRDVAHPAVLQPVEA